jgi:hypothetical protein
MRGHDLTGQRFGRLVAVVRMAQRMNGSIVWRCRCDCGATHEVAAADLRFNKTKSCGCLHREVSSKQGIINGHANRRHGHRLLKASRTYETWRAMHKRCADPENKYYGGKGIKVCERWSSFDNFLADMGERPKGKTIDRWPNPAGDYEPGNCRWATGREQRLNRVLKARKIEGVSVDIGTIAIDV